MLPEKLPSVDVELAALPRRGFRDNVTDALREAIISGKLKLGQRVSEAKIAQQLGVSRAPIREALRELEMEGLITNEPYRGTFVTSISTRDIDEIYSLRASLETLAVQAAIQRVQPEDIRQLQAFIEDMRRLASDPDILPLVRLDLRFHEYICQLSQHGRLMQAWTILARQILALYTVTDMSALVRALYGYVENVAVRHQPIVEAIAQRDVETAKRVLQEHILEVERLIVEQQSSGTTHPDSSVLPALHR